MNNNKIRNFPSRVMFFCIFSLLMAVSCNPQEHADVVIVNAKVITVDNDFSIAEALAVKGDRILAVGSEKQIKKLVGGQTKVIDAKEKAVVPGLIDAHLHPESAALSELAQEIPHVTTVGELLDWISKQTRIKSRGEWIVFPRMFFTRLQEMRPPTLAELDKTAPDHPVFLNGSYGGVINTKAMKKAGITKSTDHPGVAKDRSGLPTGILKSSAFGLLKIPPPEPRSEEQQEEALMKMLNLYNQYGITSVCSGSGNYDLFEKYKNLGKQGKLTTRINLHIRLPLIADAEEIVNRIINLKHKTGEGDEWARIGALKIVLDGGILTGTAYMREPWGKKAGEIFGFDDMEYRGVLNYTYEQLLPIASTASRLGWKFTAHCTGGGGVDLLLDVFEEVDKKYPIGGRRFSIIHANFFTPEAIRRMNRLGVYADMQAAWFYKDADAMKDILGDERVKTFMPYRSLLEGGVMVNGGSDHMVKLDPDQSINPYNPFLAMWSMITRTTENGNIVVPEEAVTRIDALKMYTINNAYATFEESLKGSLEPGKLADLAILSDDPTTCPVEQIRHIKAVLTMVGGKVVWGQNLN